MNDEFFTQALRENRYLKAIQLINRFETELEHELKRFGDQIVEANSDQFETGVEGRWNNSRSSGSVIAFARVDYDLDRVSSQDANPSDLTLNISFRWVEPAEYGHADVDGALTLLSYKIKQLQANDYEAVSQVTREDEWPVHLADDAFSNAPGIVYVPIETAADMKDAERALQEHFEEFISMYGIKADQN
jgi:hypothetical protein